MYVCIVTVGMFVYVCMYVCMYECMYVRMSNVVTRATLKEVGGFRGARNL